MIGDIPKSYFNMWRALVCLVHADHIVRDEEREFIIDEINQMPFRPSEKRLLEEELQTPNDIDKILPTIIHPDDRAELLRLAMMLFWRDGEFSKEEQAMLEKLNTYFSEIALQERAAMQEQARQDSPPDMAEQARIMGVFSRLKSRWASDKTA